jgi:hypothetical protein
MLVFGAHRFDDGAVRAGASSAIPRRTQTLPVREEASDDQLGRSKPRGAVLGFIRAASRGDYDQDRERLRSGWTVFREKTIRPSGFFPAGSHLEIVESTGTALTVPIQVTHVVRESASSAQWPQDRQ